MNIVRTPGRKLIYRTAHNVQKPVDDPAVGRNGHNCSVALSIKNKMWSKNNSIYAPKASLSSRKILSRTVRARAAARALVSCDSASQSSSSSVNPSSISNCGNSVRM